LSPLGDRNGIVQKLVDVASAIIKQLLKGWFVILYTLQYTLFSVV
jgi:hypothetical protein